MTTVSYEWTGKNKEVRTTKSYPEVMKWMNEEGGSFKTYYAEVVSQSEAYAMQGAAHAADRWHNYKF